MNMKNLENFLQFEVFEFYGKAELKCVAFDFDRAWACGFVNCILKSQPCLQNCVSAIGTRNGLF